MSKTNSTRAKTVKNKSRPKAKKAVKKPAVSNEQLEDQSEELQEQPVFETTSDDQAENDVTDTAYDQEEQNASEIAAEEPQTLTETSVAKTMPVKETKKAIILSLLQKENGTTVDEMMHETGWQKHSVRGQMSILKKALKANIISVTNGKTRTYRIELPQQEGEE